MNIWFMKQNLRADAILLIAGVLDEITLMRCVNLAHNLGMSAIVETHSSMQVKKRCV